MSFCRSNINATLVVIVALCISTTSISTTSAFIPHAAWNSPSSSSGTALCMAKTIAVFGASGLTASECVYQALKNGDTVVGLTRYGISLSFFRSFAVQILRVHCHNSHHFFPCLFFTCDWLEIHRIW